MSSAVYRYRFAGEIDEEFPTLSAVLAESRGSAVLAPGDTIELSEPIHHPRLVAADKATRGAKNEKVAEQPGSDTADADAEASAE